MVDPKPGTKTQSKSKGSQEMPKLVIIGTLAVVVFTLLFVVGRVSQRNQVVSVEGSSLVYDDSPVLGPADAPVTIVEFLDPECEACRAMYPIIKDIMKTYEGRVRLVVRYFPLHNNSVLAALATEAAGEQGKYWEMQELLFMRQPEWGEKSTPQTEVFLQYAAELNLDVNQFQAALNKSEYQEKIARDRADADKLGLRGTPSLFINGQQIRELSLDGLKTAIDAALP